MTTSLWSSLDGISANNRHSTGYKLCPHCLPIFFPLLVRKPCQTIQFYLQMHRCHNVSEVQTYKVLNPYVTNGLAHPYHLNESIVILRGGASGVIFHFYLFFDEIIVS